MANMVYRLTDTDHDDIILRTFVLFVQTAHVVLKYADAHFYRKTRLSLIKYMMLQVLTANRGTMIPSEIAQWTLRERHDITTLVDRMEAEGLVRTKRHNKDKRSIDVTLTGKGRKVLNQATPAAREIVNISMSSITEGDAILLEKFLRVLSQNAHHGLEYIAKVSRP